MCVGAHRRLHSSSEKALLLISSRSSASALSAMSHSPADKSPAVPPPPPPHTPAGMRHVVCRCPFPISAQHPLKPSTSRDSCAHSSTLQSSHATRPPLPPCTPSHASPPFPTPTRCAPVSKAVMVSGGARERGVCVLSPPRKPTRNPARQGSPRKPPGWIPSSKKRRRARRASVATRQWRAERCEGRRKGGGARWWVGFGGRYS